MRLDLPLVSINVKNIFMFFLSRFCVFDVFLFLNVFIITNISTNVIQNYYLMTFCVVRYVSINRWAIQHGKIIIQ